MANETITAKHNGQTVTLTIDIEDGVEISNIGESAEWQLKTIDNSPETYVTDHVGGRPDDRQ